MILFPFFVQASVDTGVMRAAFLYQFTKFITWPEVYKKRESFVICCVDDKKMEQELQSIIEKPNHDLFHEKSIRVTGTSFADLPETLATYPAVIVFPENEVQKTESAIARIKESGALLVTYGKGLCTAGAMVNFFIDDGRLRFEMHRANLEAAHFEVSAQLLRLALIVKD